jgi:hypothetical protein
MEAEINALLSHLATEEGASACTQTKALAALLLLYRRVLGSDVGNLEGVISAQETAATSRGAHSGGGAGLSASSRWSGGPAGPAAVWRWPAAHIGAGPAVQDVDSSRAVSRIRALCGALRTAVKTAQVSSRRPATPSAIPSGSAVPAYCHVTPHIFGKGLRNPQESGVGFPLLVGQGHSLSGGALSGTNHAHHRAPVGHDTSGHHPRLRVVSSV